MASESGNAADIRKRFQEAGFEVLAGPAQDSLEVKKNNCVWTLTRQKDSRWVTSGPPWFAVRGERFELEDHGYQHFWFREGQRVPVRHSDLNAMHRFLEEVRYLLGIKVLYHESLGTTNARSVYDRLTGRPDRNLV
jgi:hypothetical protein